MVKRPTVFQDMQLEHFIKGWKLIDRGHLIYWLLPDGDMLDCGYPKVKRLKMSHMEKRGWIKRTKEGWSITKEGIVAHQEFEKWLNPIQAKLTK